MKVMKNIDNFIKDNNITLIFLDVDGVIFHSCQAMIDILNERYGGNFDGSDVTSWNFQCCYPNMTSEEIEDTFNDPKFFDIIKPIDGALEFMERYRDKIILVTKASIENYTHIYEYSLFIDDSTQNLIDSNADFGVQMREYCDEKEREWQKGWDEMVMYNW